jgi:hypothetical protein
MEILKLFNLNLIFYRIIIVESLKCRIAKKIFLRMMNQWSHKTPALVNKIIKMNNSLKNK